VPESWSAPAPAKINLVLEVTGRRPDGYHEVDTVVQTLELNDTVTLSFDGGPKVTAAGPYAPATPCDETNLAWRAAAALARLTGNSLDGLSIALDKRIPPAGGLGGGASDAATTLRLLERAWENVTPSSLAAAAEAVGSDEPALLLGGTVRARGRGERVTPLAHLHRHGVVLLIPRDTLERKTARLFAALDALPFDNGSVSEAFAAREPHRLSSADVYNAFERVAFDVFPGLAALWEQAEHATGEPIRLAGAGPALFWIGEERRAAEVAARARALDCDVVATATAGSLWRR